VYLGDKIKATIVENKKDTWTTEMCNL